MASSFLWTIGALTASFFSAVPFGDNAIRKNLEPHLSQSARLFLPGSEGFINATTRWSAAARPDFKAIVEVKTEGDVQHVVCLGRLPLRWH